MKEPYKFMVWAVEQVVQKQLVRAFITLARQIKPNFNGVDADLVQIIKEVTASGQVDEFIVQLVRKMGVMSMIPEPYVIKCGIESQIFLYRQERLQISKAAGDKPYEPWQFNRMNWLDGAIEALYSIKDGFLTSVSTL